MRDWLWFFVNVVMVAQLVIIRILDIHFNPVVMTILSGMAVVGAGTILSLASEVAQKDLPRSFATIILALIAILPEYAVDIYFSYRAGVDPHYAKYALANMTGANRLLVGMFWPLVVFVYYFAFRRKLIRLGNISLELVFLLIASLYAFFIALKGSITLVDAGILIFIFLLYSLFAMRQAKMEPEVENEVAEFLIDLHTPGRITLNTFLFLFAAIGILAAAEPFAEGLIETGKILGINEFFLVQWLAPLASESPELIVIIILTLRGYSSWGIGALASSEVNQLTLLVATIPVAYSIGAGQVLTFGLDHLQSVEMFLTAAISFLALTLVSDRIFTLWEAVFLFLAFFLTAVYPTEMVHKIGSMLIILIALVLIITGRRYRDWWEAFSRVFRL